MVTAVELARVASCQVPSQVMAANKSRLGIATMLGLCSQKRLSSTATVERCTFMGKES